MTHCILTTTKADIEKKQKNLTNLTNLITYLWPLEIFQSV